MTNRMAKELSKRVSEVLYDYGIKKAVLGAEFEYDREKERVTFPLTLDYRDKWFKEFVKERFQFDAVDVYCLLLLHELGHHFTYDDISESLNDYCNQDKVRIALEIQLDCDTVEDTKPLNWQYWYLPDEFTATMWAVEYSNQCPEEVENFCNKINSILKKYIIVEE